MQKRFFLILVLLVFLFSLSPKTYGSKRRFNKDFELCYYLNAQGTLEQINFANDKLIIPDDNQQTYYQEVLSSIIAYRNKEFNRFDSLINTLQNDFSHNLSYDTIGYFHHLQYLKYYRNGDHQKAIEQLIYSKEIFKRNKSAAMVTDCLARYYGSYSNSIFDTFPVEDFSSSESLINSGAYELSELNPFDFWIKMTLYDKFGVLYGLDGQLDRSKYYLQYVIDHTKDKAYSRVYHNALGNLSVNQYKNGHYQESIKNALLDLESSLELERIFSITALGILLTKNYLALGQPSKAFKYIQLADTTSTKLQGVFKIDLLKVKAEYHQAIGNNLQENTFFQQYLSHKDSINYSAMQEMEFRMRVQEDFYRKIREYENELEKNRAIIKTQKQRNLIALIILIGTLIFTIIIAVMLKNIRRKNKLLKEKQDEILAANEELQSQQEELTTQNETISELNKNLELKVASRTKDLEEKSKIIEAFLYQMSHRFRTPITNLKGLLNLISIEKNPEVIPTHIKLSLTSVNKLDHLLSHIRQLLELDKDQFGKDNVRLYDVIEQIVAEMRAKYKLNGTHIINNLEAQKSPVLHAVKGYKMVMLREVLDNACKFSVLNNKSKEPRILISEYHNQKAYQIIIEDNGPGMTNEQWVNVFKPFYVGNEYSGGDGLGFYIASIAANKTGCKIDLDDTYAKGTRMIVSIPIE